MTVTPKKLAANRANSLKSTGPRTELGKNRVRMNALAHGMFCAQTVLPGEDAGEFEQFRTAVLRRLSPQDVVELMLCDRIVTAHWKLRRLSAREANACRTRSADPVERARRYVQRQRDEREFDALTYGKKYKPEARDRQDDRLFEEYERDRDATALRRLAPAELPAEEREDEHYADEMAERFSRHEQRLELSIDRNLRQLERLRKQSQKPTEGEFAQCPFLPEDAEESSEPEPQSDDQIEQIKAKESEGEEKRSTTKGTKIREEDDEKRPRIAIRVLEPSSDAGALIATAKVSAGRNASAGGSARMRTAADSVSSRSP